MIQAITMQNLTNGTVVEFDGRNFVLNSHDLDGVTLQHATTKTTHQIGASVTATNVQSRTITLIGYTQATSSVSLDANKQKLINLTAPFTDILITVTTNINVYQIVVKADGQPVQWATKYTLNNAMFCKFSLDFFAPTTLWQSPETTVLAFGGFQNNFSFPFSIPASGIAFGFPLSYSALNINNPYATTGLIFTFQPASTITNITITNTVTNQQMVLNTTVNQGQTLTINTNFGSKSITLTDGTTTTNLLGALNLVKSTWLQLEVGENTFSLDCGTGAVTDLNGTISYNQKYWGIA